ncbi:MAG TPA: hypothetical protein VKC66_01535 [Xanthobacteraceae bacterium]|nr:hypothetical protein [Xanthobacteraceae bacterium]
MIGRKGEIALDDIKRGWPNHVALPAHRVEGANYKVVRRFVGALSVAPLAYGFRRNNVDYVVICFAKAEDADAFCWRFGGEHVPLN